MSLPCTSALGTYTNEDCGEQFAGGIADIVIFTDLPTDPTDGTEVQALIDAGDAVLMKGLKVGLGEPSPITSTTLISCAPDLTTNYDRTITLMDGKVNADNIDYYNTLNAATGYVSKGVLLLNCDVDRCFYVEENIRWTGGMIVPDDDSSDPQHFSFTGNFKSKMDPALVATPANIFD